MSGGNHNYLCYAEFPKMINRISDIMDVEEELIKLGYTDIASDVHALIDYCCTLDNTNSLWRDKFVDVFRDIERYCSGDISRNTLIEQLEQYRKGGEEK